MKLFNKTCLLSALIAGAVASCAAGGAVALITGSLSLSLLVAGICACSCAVAVAGVEVLRRRKLRPRFGPAVIWLTGFSGAGKTTIAGELRKLLRQSGLEPVLLDGDEIRNLIKHTGFDEQSRKQHNRQTGLIAALMEKQGQIVIVALISPYADVRNEIRAMCRNFIEVHVATDIDTCIQRDPKGLYKKALNAEIQDFTGISAPYEAPEQPELRINTVGIQAAECAGIILRFLQEKPVART